MKRLLFLFLSTLLLSACSPFLIFGVPPQQWDQLTTEQRNDVIAAYNQRKQWDQLTQQQRSEVIAGYNQRREAQAKPGLADSSAVTPLIKKSSRSPRKCKQSASKTHSTTSTSKYLVASSIIGSLKRMIID